jgi:primosomal protein N'
MSVVTLLLVAVVVAVSISVSDGFSTPKQSSFIQKQQQQQQKNGYRTLPLSFVIATGNKQQQNDVIVLQSKTTSEEDIEEEVSRMVEEAKSQSKRMSNLRNERGVEYAPWMGISAEDEVRIKGIMRERAEARRKREREQQTTKGSLLKDSTNQELSGTGLKSKIIDNNAVELEWVTGSEKNTAGFIVKRRTSKSGQDGFDTIASFKTYGPLASKGINGGIYRYLDESIEPGNGYLYRITECDTNGEENDLSQCLVDIQTVEEQTGTKLALAGFAIVAIGVLAGSLLLDPLQ